MPLHLSSSSSRSILPPLNIMRSLSLCRKAKPTCTLSLASVSAPPPSQGSPDENAMQVDSLQLDVHFVAVPISPPKTLRRTKTKTKTTTTPTTPHDINVIPFPTSAQTTNPTTQDSSSPTTTSNSLTNSYKRPQLQKKEGLEHPVSSSASPPRKRARKGSLTTSSTSSSRNTPSARARALAQRVPPARPSTPTPDAGDEIETQTSCDKCPVEPSSVEVEQQPAVESTQQQRQDLDKQGHTDLPPYSPSPPPYSPPVVSPTPITSSPTPIPLHIPIPIAPPSDPSPPTPPTSRPLPPSPPPPPPPPPSPSPPPRRPRISPSELKFFIYLYRTLVSGLEARQRSRWDTQPIRRARDGSRREQHLDGVLVEDDDDDDTDDAAASAVDKSKELTTSLYEDLEVQDALLALRLRGFLKWNGVDEWLLKIDSSSSPPTSPTSPTSKTLNPFLEDDNNNNNNNNNSGSGGEEDTKMDVDVQEQEEQEEIPILSSQHLITVLRMRGSCGSRQGPGLGMMRKREQSKLRNCCYRAGEEDS